MFSVYLGQNFQNFTYSSTTLEPYLAPKVHKKTSKHKNAHTALSSGLGHQKIRHTAKKFT